MTSLLMTFGTLGCNNFSSWLTKRIIEVALRERPCIVHIRRSKPGTNIAGLVLSRFALKAEGRQQNTFGGYGTRDVRELCIL